MAADNAQGKTAPYIVILILQTLLNRGSENLREEGIN